MLAMALKSLSRGVKYSLEKKFVSIMLPAESAVIRNGSIISIGRNQAKHYFPNLSKADSGGGGGGGGGGVGGGGGEGGGRGG